MLLLGFPASQGQVGQIQAGIKKEVLPHQQLRLAKA